MKRSMNAQQFETVVNRLTERMQDAVKKMNEAVVSGNNLAETEHRSMLRAYDLALFSLTIHSSIVDEKESV
jgi:hypothetical protein